MDISSPTKIISQILLGLREGSDIVSERHASDLAKGEVERTPTSSGCAKGEQESTTLVDEKGEQLRDVSFRMRS